MSVSTTTTATYDLVKYSRAYSHSHKTQAEQTDLQWQHFVNPVIRLTMDTRKSYTGTLESYRLRITWTFSAGFDSMDVDQREVVFEDLDLVTYSSLPSLQAPQGMPLKAVYQDATVGIRYQHPRVPPPGTAPQYRRFQIVFESPIAASSFIESIRFICPCKANAPPPPRIARAPTAQNTTPVRRQISQTTSTPGPSLVFPPRQPPMRHTMLSTPADEGPLPSIRRTGTSLPPLTGSGPHYLPSPTATPVDAGGRELDNGSSRPSSVLAHRSSSSVNLSSSCSDVAIPVASLLAVSAGAALPAAVPGGTLNPPSPPRAPHVQLPASAPAYTGSSDSSLPSSSFPHSSSSPPPMARVRPSSPDLMPPPPVPSTVHVSRIPGALPHASQRAASDASVRAVERARAGVADATSSDSTGLDDAITTLPAATITASLRDSAGLYALPREELERLVAEVIREDGFADLMKALDGMWKVKGLVALSRS
ncbi:hypothetical protein C8Q77DRAFT_1211875 [Trametes polyzona]|nr:hypothetical protein C8Q77DRAFT_1211875 [Trametes polyzona]